MEISPQKTDITLVIAGLGSGGAQRVVTHLANYWAGQGLAVSLVTLYDEGHASFFPVDPRVSVRCIQSSTQVHTEPRSLLARLLGNLLTIIRLRRLLKRQKTKSVVGFVFVTNILLVLATRGLDLNVTISERNNPDMQSGGAFWDFMRRHCYGCADNVTANSKQAIDALSLYVPKAKLTLIPNPLPTVLATQQSRRNTFLAAGRLTQQKGYDTLLRAFAQIRDKIPTWQLEIAGQGPLDATLKQLTVELAIDSHVHWLGAVKNLPERFSDAGVFVMASRFEGMPNVVLEAMHHGMAVLVTKGCGGALDYIKNDESGLIVDTNDERSLGESMIALATDEVLRDRLGKRAKANVQSNELSRVAKTWEGVMGI